MVLKSTLALHSTLAYCQIVLDEYCQKNVLTSCWWWCILPARRTPTWQSHCRPPPRHWTRVLGHRRCCSWSSPCPSSGRTSAASWLSPSSWLRNIHYFQSDSVYLIESYINIIYLASEVKKNQEDIDNAIRSTSVDRTEAHNQTQRQRMEKWITLAEERAGSTSDGEERELVHTWLELQSRNEMPHARGQGD